MTKAFVRYLSFMFMVLCGFEATLVTIDAFIDNQFNGDILGIAWFSVAIAILIYVAVYIKIEEYL